MVWNNDNSSQDVLFIFLSSCLFQGLWANINWKNQISHDDVVSGRGVWENVHKTTISKYTSQLTLTTQDYSRLLHSPSFLQPQYNLLNNYDRRLYILPSSTYKNSALLHTRYLRSSVIIKAHHACRDVTVQQHHFNGTLPIICLIYDVAYFHVLRPVFSLELVACSSLCSTITRVSQITNDSSTWPSCHPSLRKSQHKLTAQTQQRNRDLSQNDAKFTERKFSEGVPRLKAWSRWRMLECLPILWPTCEENGLWKNDMMEISCRHSVEMIEINLTWNQSKMEAGMRSVPYARFVACL